MFAIAVIVVVSLIGVFLCSLSEAALYSVSRSRIATLKRLQSPLGLRLAKLRERVDEPIAAILIVNTMVMTLGAIWSGALVETYYGNLGIGIFSGAFTVLILFVSEIVPKSLGVRYANSLAPALAWPLQILIWTLAPFVKISSLVTRFIGGSSRLSHPTEQDIISMTMLSEASGKILKQEGKWIRNILRLNDIKTRDIMTPYENIKRIPDVLPLSEVKADWSHWRYSRVLIANDDNPDEILGLVLRRSVFAAKLRRAPDTTMKQLMIPVHFVSSNLPSHDLIEFFVKNKTQIAVVKSDEGKLVGVVTMEDVLEDMIGAEID
ncbi:MAG: CNNM domain-containing protein [Elusimicrobiota bacterium]